MAGRKKTVATKIDERGKEIIKALQSFEESKGLSVEVVCNALEEALVNAYQKSVSDEMFGSDERALARASVNPVTGEIKLFNQKRVVEEVEDDFFEISLEDAHETNPELNTTKDLYEENRKLRKELEELKKENLFLKKAAAFFAKELD